ELLALPEERQFREKQHAFSIFYGVGTTLILLGLVCFAVLFFNLRELAGVCVGVLVGGAAGAAAGYAWEQLALLPGDFLLSLPLTVLNGAVAWGVIGALAGWVFGMLH